MLKVSISLMLLVISYSSFSRMDPSKGTTLVPLKPSWENNENQEPKELVRLRNKVNFNCSKLEQDLHRNIDNLRSPNYSDTDMQHLIASQISTTVAIYIAKRCSAERE